MARRLEMVGRYFPVPVLAAGIVLLAASLGLPSMLNWLDIRFEKQPIEIRKTLMNFEFENFASFSPVLQTDHFNVPAEVPGIETAEWIHLTYDFNTAASTRPRDRQVLLLLSYYSDPRDKVSHTPEVCYRQAGWTLNDISAVTVAVGGLAGAPAIQARLLDFEHDGSGVVVLYIFVSNGRFYADRERMRLAIGMPGDCHVYYAKIETVARFFKPQDREAAVERCRRLLAEAIVPMVQRYLPEDERVRDR